MVSRNLILQPEPKLGSQRQDSGSPMRSPLVWITAANGVQQTSPKLQVSHSLLYVFNSKFGYDHNGKSQCLHKF